MPFRMPDQAQVVNGQDVGEFHAQRRDPVGEMADVRTEALQDAREPELHPYLFDGERAPLRRDQVACPERGPSEVRENQVLMLRMVYRERLEQRRRIVSDA